MKYKNYIVKKVMVIYIAVLIGDSLTVPASHSPSPPPNPPPPPTPRGRRRKLRPFPLRATESAGH